MTLEEIEALVNFVKENEFPFLQKGRRMK